MYLLYTALLAVGFVISLPWFLWKGRATGKYRASFRERMGRLPVYLNVDRERSIWIHAVSVGEVLAARTLVEPLRARFPKHRLFLSTTTVTGNAVARKNLRGLDGLFYAPFDFPGPVRQALDTLRPDLLVIMETELWPNLIHQAKRRGARVALVNGRISPRSYPRYRRIRWFMRPLLAEVDLLLMQAEPHAERALALGAPPERVRASGNLKFDALFGPARPDRVSRLFEGLGGRPVWVAGSTMEGEEALVLRAFHGVRERFPDTALVIVPRHPERFAEVPALVEAAGFRCVRRTQIEPGGWPPGAVLLLDTLGELTQVYPHASVVFVGGSLVPTGGHNVLEPAVSGRPVVVGPHMENFQEIADAFRGQGALLQVASPEELGRVTADLLADPARRQELGERARGLVLASRGAVQATLDALAPLVP
ncbi:MAG: 3-deoxy-D-manno-octulosonic acid transferase [Vicinamibacteria bacterium]